VEGVVVHYNYTGQSTPYITGFWLADDTDSIYVYGEDAAKSVAVGNMVTVKGTKAYYIPNTDSGSAASLSYEGMAQLKDPTILHNDGLTTNEIPSGAINESTVSDLSKTPLTTDISGKIYKVKGYYHKYPATGYTNYGITDLNRMDRLNAYTQSNGKDFSWTDDYDGKAVEMLLITTLAKPGSGEWKFCPVKMIREITATTEEEVAYGAERALSEFADEYAVTTVVTIPTADPKLDGLTRAFSSESPLVSVLIDGDDAKVTISANEKTTITIKATATYKGVSKDDSKDIVISGKPQIDTKTIAEANALEDGATATIEGVVAAVTYKSSLVKQGLFLADGTGSIFIYNGTSAQANLKDVEKGNKVIVTGTLVHYINSKNADNAAREGYSGDHQLANVSVDFIDSNVYEVPAAAIRESTVAAIVGTAASNNITGNIYRVNAIVKAGSYGSYSLVSPDETNVALSLYTQCGGADMAWLSDYASTTVSIVVGIQNLKLTSSSCNWRACPISVVE
jgi:RPA family protein